MSPSSKASSLTKRRRVFAGVVVCVVVLAMGALLVWLERQRDELSAGSCDQQARPVSRVPQASPTEELGTPSLADVLAVLETQEFDPWQGERAIQWLDQRRRNSQPLPLDDLLSLIQKFEQALPSALPADYQQHLFNSFCNLVRGSMAHSLADEETENSQASGEALAKRLTNQRFIVLLRHVASTGNFDVTVREASAKLTKSRNSADADAVLQLYALQHLWLLWRGERLSAPYVEADQGELVKTIAEELASTADHPAAGTALEFLAEWSSRDQATDQASRQALMELALERAADSTLPVDLRISALQSAGESALPLARQLAADSTQPTLLRKASLYRVGQSGSKEDLALLDQCASESSRLAQAANPAAQSIRRQIEYPNAPEPVLYQVVR